jgi:hypothetical protein
MTFMRKFKSQSLAPRRPSANARSALACIEENTLLASLLQQVENNQHLNRALAVSLNKNGLEMAIPHIKLGGFSEEIGELKLFALNSAVASRLQQKLPSILFKLQEQGWPVQTITVKQSPGGIGISSEKDTSTTNSRPIFSEKAQKSWEKLLPTLEDGSPLRAAVEKLLKNGQ